MFADLIQFFVVVGLAISRSSEYLFYDSGRRVDDKMFNEEYPLILPTESILSRAYESLEIPGSLVTSNQFHILSAGVEEENAKTFQKGNTARIEEKCEKIDPAYLSVVEKVKLFQEQSKRSQAEVLRDTRKCDNIVLPVLLSRNIPVHRSGWTRNYISPLKNKKTIKY